MSQGFKKGSKWRTKSPAYLFILSVVDLSFIVTRLHQKIKVLFCHINFDYYEEFCKKMFFLTFFFVQKKEKYPLNSIVLQNLLYHLFNYSIVTYFMNFMNFAFIFTFFIQHKNIHTKVRLHKNLGPNFELRPWNNWMLKNLDNEKHGKQLDTEKRLPDHII